MISLSKPPRRRERRASDPIYLNIITEQINGIIRLTQLVSKPILSNSSLRKGHSTLSYALEISSFKAPNENS